MTSGAEPSPTAEIQEYYRAIAPFLEQEWDHRQDEELWRRLAGEHPGSRVLDLGAGTGRVAAIFAPAARRVVALDLSLDLLARAPRRFVEHGNALVVAGDMRRLPLTRPFDLVLAANDPFCHLLADDERDAVFATVARLLAPAGRFYLDALWFPQQEVGEAASPEGRVNEWPVGEPPARLTVREIWHCDRRTGRCEARYDYFRSGERVGGASFEARLWSQEEIEERSARAGLAIHHLWGDYQRRSFAPERSRRLILAAGPRDGRTSGEPAL